MGPFVWGSALQWMLVPPGTDNRLSPTTMHIFVSRREGGYGDKLSCLVGEAKKNGALQQLPPWDLGLASQESVTFLRRRASTTSPKNILKGLDILKHSFSLKKHLLKDIVSKTLIYSLSPSKVDTNLTHRPASPYRQRPQL